MKNKFSIYSFLLFTYGLFSTLNAQEVPLKSYYLKIPEIGDLKKLSNDSQPAFVLKYEKTLGARRVTTKPMSLTKISKLEKQKTSFLNLKTKLESEVQIIKRNNLGKTKVFERIKEDSVLANYYVSDYLLPLRKAESHIFKKKYREALQDLYQIHKPIVPKDSDLEIMIKNNFGRTNNSPLIISNTVPINNYLLFTNEEKEIHKERIAYILLDWGKHLQLSNRDEEASGVYLEILRLFPNLSKTYILKKPAYRYYFQPLQPVPYLNDPETMALISEALWGLYSVGNGSDYTGFNATSIPIWTYEFLRETTKEFLNTAKDLERNLYGLIKDQEGREEKELLLEQSLEMAELNILASQNRVKYAEQVLNISKDNVQLAKLRFENKEDQANQTKETIKYIKKQQEKIRKKQMFASILSAGINTGLTGLSGGISASKAGGQANFGSGTASGALRSGLGGSISNALFGSSIQKAQNAIQNRQAEDQLDQLKREAEELNKAVEITSGEYERDGTALELAIMDLDQAYINQNHLRKQLDALQNNNSIFNLEESIITAIKILNQYLKYSVYLAQLTEKAYQIEELDDTKIIKDDKFYLDLTTKEDVDLDRVEINWLAADKLLLDLNTIEYRRITRKKQKENHNTYYISLRNKEPFGLEELRQDGRMSFDITQFELDLAFPGTYRHLISDISVDVIALTDPSGVKGQLTKESLSWTKVPNTFTSSNTIGDWFQSIPSDYSLIVFKDDPETLTLPKAPIGSYTQTPGLKRIFEDKGICGTYTLELPKYSNTFNYGTVYDIIITVNFSCYFDPILKGMIESELCQMERREDFINKRTLSYSVVETQPDEWYHFKNPILADTLSKKTRIIPFYFFNGYVPNNHIDPILNGISLSFSQEGEFLPMKFEITSASLNSNIDFIDNGKLNTDINYDALKWKNDFSFATNGSETIHIYESKSSPQENLKSSKSPYELWFIKINADDNPLLQNTVNPQYFDEKKIKEISNIILGFDYTFSFDFCFSEPEVLAAMNIDNEVKVDSVLVHNGNNVPYLNVRSKNGYVKKYDPSTPKFKWNTNVSNGSFEVTNILPSAANVDAETQVIKFGNFVEIKGDVETVEFDFDLKEGETIFYYPPIGVRSKASRSNNNRKLEIQVDTISRNNIQPGETAPAPSYFTIASFEGDQSDDSFKVFFRFVSLPNLSKSATFELFVEDFKTNEIVEIFDRPIPFSKSETGNNNPQRTNFNLRVRGSDEPKPNIILKNIIIRDFSKR